MKIERLVTGAFQVNTYFIPVIINDLLQVVIVDPGGDEDNIFAKLEMLELNPIAIVLTHGHFDHVGAIPALKERYPDLQVAIHSADSKYLGKNGFESHYTDFNAMGASGLVRFVEQRFPKLPEPDFFLEELKMPACMPDWIVLHTPGHSAGSVCFYNAKELILLSGDTMFAGSYGRTDLIGGSMQKMNASLKKLLTLPDTVQVFPGHGSFTTIGKERSNYEW